MRPILTVRLRGYSHMTSAKNGGVKTPPPPLVSQIKKIPYPPPPPSQKKQTNLLFIFNTLPYCRSQNSIGPKTTLYIKGLLDQNPARDKFTHLSQDGSMEAASRKFLGCCNYKKKLI